MKHTWLFIFLTLFLASCGDDEVITNEEEELVDNFEISGTINGGENVSVYLEALSQQGTISVADARTDASGSFKMSGNIPGFGLYQLRLGESQDKIIPLTLVPDDKIKINADFATYELKPNLSGSKWASTMNDYMAVFSKFHVGQQELMNKRDSIPAEELTDLFTKLKTPIDSFSLVRMDKDPSNPFNIVLQGAAVPSMGFNDWDEKNLEVLTKVASAFEEKYPGSPVTTTMTNQVYQIEMEYNQHIANSSGTRVAPEIALKNPDGVEMKLSTLRGQYVLIDFWASWCMPCRRENPNVVRLYNKYKNKGFTIFSVSLDKDAEAWKEAIEKDGLVWPNHVSDLLQWNSPLPQLYGFSGIPHTVLVNPQGNIIGVGLRGASLEQKLEEIFAK
jgi:thiol-disulfide isomerase/thioredoxin